MSLQFSLGRHVEGNSRLVDWHSRTSNTENIQEKRRVALIRMKVGQVFKDTYSSLFYDGLILREKLVRNHERTIFLTNLDSRMTTRTWFGFSTLYSRVELKETFVFHIEDIIMILPRTERF